MVWRAFATTGPDVMNLVLCLTNQPLCVTSGGGSLHFTRSQRGRAKDRISVGLPRMCTENDLIVKRIVGNLTPVVSHTKACQHRSALNV